MTNYSQIYGSAAQQIRLMSGQNQAISQSFRQLAGLDSVTEQIRQTARSPLLEIQKSMHKSLATTLAASMPRLDVGFKPTFIEQIHEMQRAPFRDAIASVQNLHAAPFRDTMASIQKMHDAQFAPMREMVQSMAAPAFLTDSRQDWFRTLERSDALVRRFEAPVRPEIEQIVIEPVSDQSEVQVTQQLLRRLVDATEAGNEATVAAIRSELELVRAELSSGSEPSIQEDVTVWGMFYVIAQSGMGPPTLTSQGLSGAIGLVGLWLTRWANNRFGR